MKIVKIDELRRNPYYSNSFLLNQWGLRHSVARGILDMAEGRALTAREYVRTVSIKSEACAIMELIKARKGADRDVYPLMMGDGVIDITKHEKAKRRASKRTIVGRKY